MKLQQMKQGQFFVTLPRQIILAKEWKKGDEITTNVDNKGNIVLSRKQQDGFKVFMQQMWKALLWQDMQGLLY